MPLLPVCLWHLTALKRQTRNRLIHDFYARNRATSLGSTSCEILHRTCSYHCSQYPNMVSKGLGHSQMEPMATCANAVGEEQRTTATNMWR
jgi:hypothetical protein